MHNFSMLENINNISTGYHVLYRFPVKNIMWKIKDKDKCHNIIKSIDINVYVNTTKENEINCSWIKEKIKNDLSKFENKNVKLKSFECEEFDKLRRAKSF